MKGAPGIRAIAKRRVPIVEQGLSEILEVKKAADGLRKGVAGFPRPRGLGELPSDQCGGRRVRYQVLATVDRLQAEIETVAAKADANVTGEIEETSQGAARAAPWTSHERRVIPLGPQLRGITIKAKALRPTRQEGQLLLVVEFQPANLRVPAIQRSRNPIAGVLPIIAVVGAGWHKLAAVALDVIRDSFVEGAE